MTARFLIFALSFATMPALAQEAELGRKVDVAYAENLCKAGVAASTSRRARNIPAEVKSCVDSVRSKMSGSRLLATTFICESSFRGKPPQRKACYQESFALNLPSTPLAGIAYECGQHRDDIMFSACVRLEYLGLDRRLSEPPVRRAGNRRGHGSS